MKTKNIWVGILVLAISFVSQVTAQNSDNSESSENKKANLLSAMGAENPGNIPVSGRDQITEGLEAYAGIEASTVGNFNDDAADDSAFRSEVYVTLGVDIIDRINIEAGLSFQDILSQASDDDFDGTYSTGLTSVQARDVVNKLRISAILFKLAGKEDSKVPVLAVSAKAGRYQVDQVGSFIPSELLVTESVLTPYKLEQQDAIGVAARINGKTLVEVNFHGNDWLGYTTDALEDVEQDGEGSFAINVLHDMAMGGNEIQLKFSYIDNKDGVYYTRSLASEQLGENTTIAAGAALRRDIKDLGTLIVAAEGMYIDRADSDDEMIVLDVFTAMEFENLPVTPFADLAWMDDGMTSDWAATLGAALRVIDGLTLSAGIQFVDREDADDTETNFFVGLTLSEPEQRVVQTVSE